MEISCTPILFKVEKGYKSDRFRVKTVKISFNFSLIHLGFLIFLMSDNKNAVCTCAFC